MPKCEKCFKMFPPNFIVPIPQNPDAGQCVYCEKGVSELPRTLPDGTKENYTKEQCIKDYEAFTKKLAEKIRGKGDIQEIFNSAP